MCVYVYVCVSIYVICVVICNTLSWKICDIKIAYRRLYKYVYYERVRVFVPSVSLGAIAFICKRV